ncbi:MAG: hypothetical protein U0V18_04755 [Anaerolineales bacterium]
MNTIFWNATQNENQANQIQFTNTSQLPPSGGSWKGGPNMPKDQAHLEAEKKILNDHPRIRPITNARMSACIRLFVKNSWTVLTPKGG